MDELRLFKAIFGVKPSLIRETVVLSPIFYPKQFEKITGQTGKHYKSILGYLIANFRNQTFIKTPMTQGAVLDAVLLLSKTPCKRVVFIGAIGGLQKGLRIGDIVVSKRAKDVYSVKSFHEETRKKLLSLRKKGIIGIDFESRAFFSAAKKAKLSAIAYYVVTDLPLSKPFYVKKSKSEEERVRDSIARVLVSAYEKHR
jgi:hypothetical protein